MNNLLSLKPCELSALSVDTRALPRSPRPALANAPRAAAGCRPAPSPYRRPNALVGNTPVLRISTPLTPAGRGFWAKLEGSNPGGSMKDRPALHMVSRARARGQLRAGARIVESTSGSLRLGLALAGMAYGHRGPAAT